MIRRVIGMGLIIITAAAFAGCTPAPQGKITGFRYILNESNAKRDAITYAAQLVPEKNINASGNTVSQPAAAQVSTWNSVTSKKAVKKVFLTFDDGPESTITPAVLDTLDKYGVKATFFVVGTSIQKNPGILKEILRRGHKIGNHTYNHKYKELYSTKGGFIKSLKINEEIIYRNVGLKPYIIRDPGGKVQNNWPLREELGQHKYWLIGWNVDSYDSRKPYHTAPQIIENVRVQIKNPKIWDNMIILMHDGRGHSNTVTALPAIIEMLIKDGFTFEVVK